MDLTGKNIVVTGSLCPLTREEAIRFLESKGAVVQNYVSSRTDILVLGHKQLNLFDLDKRSKKHDEALRRISDGQSITFLSEESFFDLVKKSQD
ncbi:TPA: BRCT domain-containing protein [Streptococcus agalactiae]|uniref:BRCT domain-containing protein n=1 Tax=Streptococcus TaxID=1301 RepID=UPI0002BA3CCD|nr:MULTISPECIES: BRCT domain-containing protein [Streptococcus]HEP4295776.1 BRCT domain-containing protein [Streptococcus pyogenes]EPV37557.1 hypothetical protein SAG0347_02625 [Streptococcus agalactiae GB00891]EPW98587.1 hypothetical protein SAG0144_08095 [Streptococcus agalactiae MRI Z1-035]KAA9229541.1 hypothetical protein F6I38_04615 [Streptococcus anginosus]KAA9262040.1 hypothetical protein F6I23_01490 [Streptococcus anginosus]